MAGKKKADAGQLSFPGLIQEPALAAEIVGTRGGGPDTAGADVTLHVSSEANASFFRAAAALYRADPWARLPVTERALSATIDALGVDREVLLVFGLRHARPGLMLLGSPDELGLLLDAIEDELHPDEESAPALRPERRQLTFDPADEASDLLRLSVAAHGWEIADEAAYPRLARIVEDEARSSVTPVELTIMEALALALLRVLDEGETLRPAWTSDEPWERTYLVETASGPYPVRLSVPLEDATPPNYAPPYDVMEDLFAIGLAGDDLDLDRRGPLEDELLRRFEASPEGQGVSGIHGCSIVMDYAARHLGVTIATLEAEHLEEVLFDIVPEKVTMRASGAGPLVKALRAFFAYLKREHRWAHADACLEVLGKDAVRDLQAALSDRSRFGMAKSMMMGGLDAGFAIDTQEGAEAWLRALRSGAVVPASGALGGGARHGGMTKGQAAQKKSKQKAARKARKKNR